MLINFTLCGFVHTDTCTHKHSISYMYVPVVVTYSVSSAGFVHTDTYHVHTNTVVIIMIYLTNMINVTVCINTDLQKHLKLLRCNMMV